MRFLNEQAQLFMVAALCMVIGLGALYLALELYALAINKLLKEFCAWGAILAFIRERRNENQWWIRLPRWLDRFSERNFD